MYTSTALTMVGHKSSESRVRKNHDVLNIKIGLFDLSKIFLIEIGFFLFMSDFSYFSMIFKTFERFLPC